MKELTMRGAKNGMSLVLPDNQSRLKVIEMLCFCIVPIGASVVQSKAFKDVCDHLRSHFTSRIY